jgi:predicted pyridoxine 5'-phosphate oxidase superfamily flavin-nucleotide-binding protein
MEHLNMKPFISDIAFSEAVKAEQERLGSRETMANLEQSGQWLDYINEDLAIFVLEQDSFFLGTASRNGQPYIQHRGGRPSVLSALDSKYLIFPDYKGNKHYISIGNLSENNQAFLFLLDRRSKTRIKIWGELSIEEDAQKIESLKDKRQWDEDVNRVMLFKVRLGM